MAWGIVGSWTVNFAGGCNHCFVSPLSAWIFAKGPAKILSPSLWLKYKKEELWKGLQLICKPKV